MMLIAVLLAAWLGERFGRSLILPLLILSQIGEFLILCWMLWQLLIAQISPTAWVVQGVAWLLAALYYALCDPLVRRKYSLSPFPFAAVFCLGVFPLFLMQARSPDAIQVAWLAFIWGLLFSVAGEWFWRRDEPR